MIKEKSLLNIGFIQNPLSKILKTFNYDLGRNRFIGISSLGTTNEMIFIFEKENKQSTVITDIITLRNYDYDGFTSLKQIKSIIKTLQGDIPTPS